jgi:predicted CopG family antitoxin
MIRTQISLDEDAYREAKDEARRQGISLAEFLRRLVAGGLRHRRANTRPWMQHAGQVSSNDPSASRSVNAVVYDRPRP